MNESKNNAIGQAGEDAVAMALEDIPGTRLLRNLYVPCGNGRTAEIDALMVTNKGLFAIECKAWSGHTIRGSARLNDWSVKATAFSKPVKRYSPIKQAEGHAKTLVRYLKLSVSKLPHNIIVFTSTSVKLNVPESNAKFTIVQGTESLREAILKQLKLRNEIFTDAQLQSIIESLEKTTEPPDKTKKNHVKQAKRSQRRRLAQKERRRRARKGTRKKPRIGAGKRTVALLILLNFFHWLLA